jgi:hypothetical protein
MPCSLLRMATVAQDLDPSKHTVCLCHHGIRSMQMGSYLTKQGFEQVCRCPPCQKKEREKCPFLPPTPCMCLREIAKNNSLFSLCKRSGFFSFLAYTPTLKFPCTVCSIQMQQFPFNTILLKLPFFCLRAGVQCCRGYRRLQ